MNRVELLEAASMKLAEAVMLLTEAGEKRLAAYAGEIAEIAEILTLPFEKLVTQAPHLALTPVTVVLGSGSNAFPVRLVANAFRLRTRA